MNDYQLSDKEQIEMLKKFWVDYGKPIMLAVIIGLLIGFGWRYWQNRNLQKLERASNLYQQLLFSASQSSSAAQVKPLATSLVMQYPKTAYAMMAEFFLAQASIKENNFPQALQQLQWILKNSRDSNFRQIARLRISRLFLVQKHYDDALKILRPLKDTGYEPLKNSLEGDIYTQMGQARRAQKSYQLAKAGFAAMGLSNPYLEMKI